MKRVLVTGSSGFIGSAIVERLSRSNDVESIFVVDVTPVNRPFSESIVSITMDLSERRNLDKLPRDIDTVFVVAALNGTKRFYQSPYTVFYHSLLSTLNVLDFYKELPGVKFLYSSSSEVYANTVEVFGGRVPSDESIALSIGDPKNPRWSYGTAKLAGEVAFHSAATQFGTQASIVRYHNVYGPNMAPDHFVPDFMNRAKQGIFSIRGPQETRSFLYLDDAIDGTLRAIRLASRQVPTFHLGSSEEISIENAARIILEEMDLGVQTIVTEPGLPGSVPRRCPDCKRAKEILEWEARYTFREGIRRIISLEFGNSK